jgi:hypothetical protein
MILNQYVVRAVLLLLLAVGQAPVKEVSSPTLERWTGHWQGTILVVPAEFELDLAFDLSRDPSGGAAGSLSLPDQGLISQKVENLTIHGREISFAYRDGKDTSRFEGRLSEDGKAIAGTVKDPGKTYEFVLRRDLRSGAAAPVPAVRQLSESGEELRSLFNQDAGRVRLLMILSPT